MATWRRQIGGLTVRTAAAKLALAVVVGSVVYALSKGSFGVHLLLIPSEVLNHAAAWQVLTYAFIAGDPLEVIFGALILWQIGGALEATWGPRRLLAFAGGVTVLAGVLTVLLALLYPGVAFLPFRGVYVMSTSVWVAYGLSFGRNQTNFWGIPVSGYMFALIGAGFVLLSGAFTAWSLVIPGLFGLALTLAYMRGADPRLLWLRFGSWRLQRQLKGRSKHLRVVGKDRNIGGGSDGYLH